MFIADAVTYAIQAFGAGVLVGFVFGTMATIGIAYNWSKCEVKKIMQEEKR